MDEANDIDLHLVEPGPKRKSKFWAYFKAYDLEHHPDKTHTARCVLCGKDISVKQGTGGLVRHLQHKHSDESEELAAITASYPSRQSDASMKMEDPAVFSVASDNGVNGSSGLTPPRKKMRLSSPFVTEGVDAKIKREEHNLRMWRDAKEQVKQLKAELLETVDEEEIAEIEADLKGFKNRKANYAKLLGFE